LAKIAANLKRLTPGDDGAAGRLRTRVLAATDDWSVEDVTCTAGPRDAPFEEQHSCFRIALVGNGTFQCQGPRGEALMTPGALLLGTPGECFECGHEHGTGDRCLSFGYSPSYFERLAADAGTRGRLLFDALRVPPIRELAPLVAASTAAWDEPSGALPPAWNELGMQLAAAALRVTGRVPRPSRVPLNAEGGVTRAVRLIDRDPCAALPLAELAREASLSRYHFLRAFALSTGLTPHRYVLRARLRAAAARLMVTDERIIDVALGSGFGDVSNFNRAFRTEFGASPRAHRARSGDAPSRRSRSTRRVGADRG
jgi:AraC-like DNA-binding protein